MRLTLYTFLSIAISTMYCGTLKMTNRNATEPVMVGKIDSIGSKGKETKTDNTPYRVMDYAMTRRLLFFVFAYSFGDNTSHSFADVADTQYARTVEATRCSHRVREVKYNTYTIYTGLFNQYANSFTAVSNGAIKCAK